MEWLNEVGPLCRGGKRAATGRGPEPNHVEALYNLGFVLARLGKPAEALPQLQKALQLDPNFNDARFQLVFVLRALGRQEESREQLKIFTEAKQKDVRWKSPRLRATRPMRICRLGMRKRRSIFIAKRWPTIQRMLALTMTSVLPWRGLATTPESGPPCRTP